MVLYEMVVIPTTTGELRVRPEHIAGIERIAVYKGEVTRVILASGESFFTMMEYEELIRQIP